MTIRTKGEQKAYLDGYEMCAECIEKYLTTEGKQKLECLLMAVRNAVEIEDENIEPDRGRKELQRMKEDIFVIVRYALAEPKKETGSFEEQDFTFNFVAENGLDNAIKDINNYILSKYHGREQNDLLRLV